VHTCQDVKEHRGLSSAGAAILIGKRLLHATSRKVAGSNPDEVDFLNSPNPSGRTGPGVDSASNRNEYQESLKIKKPGGKVQRARRADNLAAIY
jgi:hypothetical protein